MFTLKLYRRVNDQKVSLVIGTHHVVAMELPSVKDKEGNICLLELRVYHSASPLDCDSYFVGDASSVLGVPNSIIDDRGDGHNSLWGWGLLENAAGKTSEHYRPASYG